MKHKKTQDNSTQVIRISLSKLQPFANHPFKVIDDESMTQIAESIKEYGVLMPAIARPLETGGYELISGHRRHRACQLAELEHMPVIVRNLDDSQATIIMVDSNLQRENILPSERAFAYKMKLDAIKKQGERTDLTSTQIGQKSETSKTSLDVIAENVGTSKNQVQRYISLTKLNPQILDMIDNKQMGLTPTVELSALNETEQIDFLDVIEAEQSIPSLSQAQRIKALSKDGNCNFETMSSIMKEEKKSEIGKISFPTDKLRKYFPKSYTPQKIQTSIIKLLEKQSRKKQQER